MLDDPPVADEGERQAELVAIKESRLPGFSPSTMRPARKSGVIGFNLRRFVDEGSLARAPPAGLRQIGQGAPTPT